MENRVFNFRDLLPRRYREGLFLSSMEDLVFIGPKNLAVLDSYWRTRKRDVDKELNQVQALVDSLEDVDVERFCGGLLSLEHTKIKDSTFVRCNSHCRYWDQDSYVCVLLPQEGNYGLKWCVYPSNSGCEVFSGKEPLFYTCKASWKSRLAELAAKSADIAGYLWYIEEAYARQSEDKPYFVSFRPLKWFREGEDVVCYLHEGGFVSYPLKPDTFIAGKVVSTETLARDHVVTVQLDEKQRCGWRNEFGFEVYKDDFLIHYDLPLILHPFELEYLKGHQDYLKVWLSVASKSTNNFFPTDYYMAVQGLAL